MLNCEGSLNTKKEEGCHGQAAACRNSPAGQRPHAVKYYFAHHVTKQVIKMSRDSAQQQIREACAAKPRRQTIHSPALSLLVHILACDFTYLPGAPSLPPVATLSHTYAKLDQMQICRASLTFGNQLCRPELMEMCIAGVFRCQRS